MAKYQFVSWNIILVFPLRILVFPLIILVLPLIILVFPLIILVFPFIILVFPLITFVFPFITLQTEAGRPFWYFLERRRLLFLSKPTKMSYQRLTKGAIYVQTFCISRFTFRHIGFLNYVICISLF